MLLITQGQLFKRSLAIVLKNRLLSHFQFAESFYVNTIYRVQLIKKTKKEFVPLKYSIKEEIWGPKLSQTTV